jgi:hypothetical protein
MGGHPYQYVVDYQEDLQEALSQLRADVFRKGEYHGADRGAKTPKEALKAAGETGTRSILDILRVQKKPDYCCAAPLTPEELRRYFGAEAPTVAMVEQCDEFWEDLERGKARIVLIRENGVPTKIVFAGYSFD